MGTLSRLKKLHLSDNPIGDAGLARLSGQLSLEDLELDGTNVTDAGLLSLCPVNDLDRRASANPFERIIGTRDTKGELVVGDIDRHLLVAAEHLGLIFFEPPEEGLVACGGE